MWKPRINLQPNVTVPGNINSKTVIDDIEMNSVKRNDEEAILCSRLNCVGAKMIDRTKVLDPNYVKYARQSH
ncbi:CLUMA_CG001758, isoform A [Clunio marinus]|uniref:CLUMA_CG001758, isoform A n=1 Tax=Clunio marinus TaxID=568069 RepID=A0A1J1HKN4_9DIPT|nr:CLUMA_CG001758, isoform A [Clunio marinus]